MGWCHEFGPQIGAGCDHPMAAAEGECRCTACGVHCTGRFKGCPTVWTRRAAPPVLTARRTERPPEVAPAVEAVPVSGGDVFTALDAIGSELRALRATIENDDDGLRPAPADHITALLDGIPERIRSAMQQQQEIVERRPSALGPLPE